MCAHHAPMQEPISQIEAQPALIAPRRGFFAHIVALATLGLSGFATSTAEAQTAEQDGPDWPGALKGRHRQVFDVYDINDGFPLGFTNNFITPNQSATAVMIFRHKGLPYALDSTIGESTKWGRRSRSPILKRKPPR